MERAIFEMIYGLSFRSDILDSFLVFFAQQLPYIIVVFPFIFLLQNFKKYLILPVLAFLAAGFANFAIVNTVKFLFFRNRPFTEEGIVSLFEKMPTASFPSSHAAFFFALSTVIFFYNKKAGYILFVVSALVAIARIASGVHWPLDILVGAGIGILVGWIVWIVAQKLLPESYRVI